MTGANGTTLTHGERIDRMRARSWALHILYTWETREARQSLTEVMEETFRSRRVADARIPLIRRHIARVDEHLSEVDVVLAGAMDNWRLERLSRIDRSVLRLAATEMVFCEEVPEKVALQEGIRLAGQYGGDDSSRFVNGVLDAVLRTHRGG